MIVQLDNIPELHELLHALPSMVSSILVGSVIGVIALLVVELLPSKKRV